MEVDLVLEASAQHFSASTGRSAPMGPWVVLHPWVVLQSDPWLARSAPMGRSAPRTDPAPAVVLQMSQVLPFPLVGQQILAVLTLPRRRSS